MVMTVYHDPLKLHVSTNPVPDFLVNLTIPLLSDNTLRLLGLSTFAKEHLQHETVPDYPKILAQAVLALKPYTEESLTPHLHF